MKFFHYDGIIWAAGGIRDNILALLIVRLRSKFLEHEYICILIESEKVRNPPKIYPIYAFAVSALSVILSACVLMPKFGSRRSNMLMLVPSA